MALIQQGFLHLAISFAETALNCAFRLANEKSGVLNNCLVYDYSLIGFCNSCVENEKSYGSIYRYNIIGLGKAI